MTYAPSGVLGAGLRGALFRNLIGNENHWLGLRLVGVASNRDAYGARVLLTSGGATQLREVHTSSVESQPLQSVVGEIGKWRVRDEGPLSEQIRRRRAVLRDGWKVRAVAEQPLVGQGRVPQVEGPYGVGIQVRWTMVREEDHCSV